jgi:hypothetical protein
MTHDDDCSACYMDWPEDPRREELLQGGAVLGAALGGAFLLGVGVTVAYAAIAGGIGG